MTDETQVVPFSVMKELVPRMNFMIEPENALGKKQLVAKIEVQIGGTYFA
jgi:hypothetical protein